MKLIVSQQLNELHYEFRGLEANYLGRESLRTLFYKGYRARFLREVIDAPHFLCQALGRNPVLALTCLADFYVSTLCVP